MVRASSVVSAGVVILLAASTVWGQERSGGIRGFVMDTDFDAPLPVVKVTILETGQTTDGNDQGNFVFSTVVPGEYTLVVSKEGYTRQVRARVVVTEGQMTELDFALAGEFVEMSEFIVQDVQLSASSEGALLTLRAEAPALMDSIGADLMSRAGVSDAASALRLVAGASVQDGRFAVIRGLPDRYVSAQMNSVRLPTADVDKRAVELDQFPTSVIESIQVSKTFTPDQQGDASGGAVNVVLRGIPDENILQIGSSYSFNTQTPGNKRFLTYRGGGVSTWGMDGGGRDIQPSFTGPNNGRYSGAVGVSRSEAPSDYKVNLATGGRHAFDGGLKIGGFVSSQYERSSAFDEDGIDDKWYVSRNDPATGMLTPPRYVPRRSQEGGPLATDPHLTSLYDITQGVQEVKWSGLITLGAEIENHALTMAFLTTRVAEDKATLGENTRGKTYAFPGYDPDDFTSPGWLDGTASPYTRTETLQYTERTTQTFQVRGKHTLAWQPVGWEQKMLFLAPELDWTFARSSAGTNQPDKRLFGTTWYPGLTIPNVIVIPGSHEQLKTDAAFTLGNFNRIWKEITEESEQFFINFKVPFEQWSGDEGYLKFGVFQDLVHRDYKQDSFTNLNDNTTYAGDFDEFWSEVFPSEFHRLSPAHIDVDYVADQKIFAWYSMAELPVSSFLSVIGGVRLESTDLQIEVFPDTTGAIAERPRWIPTGSTTSVLLSPGDADVDFFRRDLLPSLGFSLDLIENLTLRGSYSRTVARQTFKELTPIQQSEYLGGDIFIGNPELKMSDLTNYDLRLDFTPYEGGLVSVSYFYKDVVNPIEYVQRTVEFLHTFPVNYPTGTLSGYEFEVRQSLGHFWDNLNGLSIGANHTIIDSDVILPKNERTALAAAGVIMPSRRMTNAPSYLTNLFLTYDLEATGTQFSAFYSLRGDTLIAGATTASGALVPNIFESDYGTLNLGLTQKIGKYIRLNFQAKNLTDPVFSEVYRSDQIGEQFKRSSRKGIDLSVSISARFNF